jgi:hypothetical protein
LNQLDGFGQNIAIYIADSDYIHVLVFEQFFEIIRTLITNPDMTGTNAIIRPKSPRGNNGRHPGSGCAGTGDCKKLTSV